MNNYELLGVVGQGQFGVAHKARNKQDGLMYCIKKIPMSAKEESKASLKEAQLLASLDHPNVLAYKECFVDTDESLCIVTSFCEEGDLFNRIRKIEAAKTLFTENEIMDAFLQIASSLMYIHGKKIMHRDLKTQNIFLAKGGIMVLGDFGISKVLAKTADFATTVAGTPYYMAPEICTNQPYTFKSDIWSLGCVLYELCTLKHAFAADSLLSLVYSIVRGNFPPISTETYTTGLSELVNALLVREADKRPSLQQIFRMPYVHAHVQRFHAEEKRRMERTAATMTRRKDNLLKTIQEAKGMTVDKEFESLTPAQKRDRRKELENKKRELELQLATISMHGEKERALHRREQTVHKSNTGYPGAAPQTVQSGRGASGTRSTSPWALDDATAGRGRTIAGIGENSMVNFGTMPSSHPFDATAQKQASSKYNDYDNRPVGGKTLGAGATVLMGSVVQGGNQSRSGSARPGNTYGGGNSMVNIETMPAASSSGRAFKFGTTNAGSLPALPSFPSRSANSSMTNKAETPPFKSAISDEKYDYVFEQANQEYRDEFSDYEDDDFDTLSPEDEQEVVHTRMKMLNNIEEMGKMDTYNFDDSMSNTMAERVNTVARTDKAAALQAKCQAVLGRRFGDVYAYLRRVRTAGSGPVDEKEVQRRLRELVGSEPTLLQGCFFVDQLVFQESMYR